MCGVTDRYMIIGSSLVTWIEWSWSTSATHIWPGPSSPGLAVDLEDGPALHYDEYLMPQVVGVRLGIRAWIELHEAGAYLGRHQDVAYVLPEIVDGEAHSSLRKSVGGKAISHV